MKNLGYLTLALALVVGCQNPAEEAPKTIEELGRRPPRVTITGNLLRPKPSLGRWSC